MYPPIEKEKIPQSDPIQFQKAQYFSIENSFLQMCFSDCIYSSLFIRNIGIF